MPDLDSGLANRLSLVDAVDRLLDKGAVLTGETILSLAGVDLVYLGLNVIIASVETLRKYDTNGRHPPSPSPTIGRRGASPAPGNQEQPDSDLADAEEDAGAAIWRGTPLPALGEATGVRAGSEIALPPSSSRLYPDSQTHGAESSPPEPGPAVVPLTSLPERLAADTDDRPERGLARLVLTLIELLRQILERQALRRAEGTGLSAEEVERMGVALMELEAKMAELRDAFGLSEEDLNLDLGPLGGLL